jgi:UDP-glucose 4-epimerase
MIQANVNRRATGTKALVTGGAGFIGSHLAESLLVAGYQVTVIDDLSTGRFDNIAHLASHPGFRFAIDTITNEALMDRLVSECDVLLHLAAAVGVDLIVRDPVHVIETNILGTHIVLKVATRYRKKVLLASTSEIYGKNQRVPFPEDADRVLGPTTKARWCYSTSKAVDEFLALAYHRQKDLPVVIFRLFNTVGPRQTGQYGMVVPRFVHQAIQRTPLTVYGDGHQTRSFCDVQDAVRAIVGLTECEDAIGHVFNIGSADEISILDLAKKILAMVSARRSEPGGADLAAGPESRIVMVPYDEAYEPGFEDMLRRLPNTSKIKQLTGWEPRSTLEETLQRVIAYCIAQELG